MESRPRQDHRSPKQRVPNVGINPLDPRAAELVVNATLQAVEEKSITTLMITHNMDHAIAYGDRLLMMHEGRIILDLDKAGRANLTRADLVDRFHDVITDRMVLS